ncbi:MAG: phosphoenolpyruvate synthase, partial [Candidatus Micrarchaeota archaeon]
MKRVYWFSEISKDNLAIAGGKGANLGEIMNAGFPVPDGFVVSAEAYFEFIKENGIDRVIQEHAGNLNVDDNEALNRASEEIKKAILKGTAKAETRAEIIRSYNRLCGVSLIPTRNQEVYVAVRSSATAEDLPEASFAGQQATFLNVKGADDLVNAVRKCWASLFEARAIYYREQNGFEHLKVGLCAIVQKMVQSDISGVMFTVDPVTNNEDTIVIESGFGLGEAIVSGQITPDRYIVDKNTGKIIEKTINEQEMMITRVGEKTEHVDVPEELREKQKLGDDEIETLAQYGLRIEEHYGFPQDIEWAVEGRKMYIVQSRAITTLNKTKQVAAKAKEDAEPIDELMQDFGASEERGEEMQEEQEASEEEVLLKGLSASPGIAGGKVTIVSDEKNAYKVKQGDVLVAKMTSPDFVPAMKRAAAIVTDEGGSTSHAAIVSRELGVPCIVGTQKATKILKDGQKITVDATRGIVYAGLPSEAQKAEAHEIQQAPAAGGKVITGTKIYVNLAEPEAAERVAKRDVDGIGLLRAEFMVAGLGVHPRALIKQGRQQEFIDALAKGLRKVCAAFYPRKVTYRATDFKTDEYKNLKGGEEFEPHEDNPMIGFRGCFRYLKDAEVFNLELEAIKKVRNQYGLKN